MSKKPAEEWRKRLALDLDDDIQRELDSVTQLAIDLESDCLEVIKNQDSHFSRTQD